MHLISYRDRWYQKPKINTASNNFAIKRDQEPFSTTSHSDKLFP